MIRKERNQPIYNQGPRLMGCDRKRGFHGINVFMPPHSRAYVTNQSYTIGASRLEKTIDAHVESLYDAEYITSDPASILSIHPAIAKAWVTFSGVSGEVYEGFNIRSVHKQKIGSYVISFILPMTNTAYVPVVIAEGFNVQAVPTLLKTQTLEVATNILMPNAKTSEHDSRTLHVVVFGSLHPSYL